jgi:predicted DNA-binding transcriptional regulator AlpA
MSAPVHEPAVALGDVLLTRKQVLSRIAMGRSWLRSAVVAGRFPAPVRIGGRVLWSQREVAAWIADALARGHAAAAWPQRGAAA